MINEYAWDQLENDGHVDHALTMSLKGLTLVDERDTYSMAVILDTIALAYFKKGNKAEAVKRQVLAIQYLEKHSSKKTELNEFKQRLKQYQ